MRNLLFAISILMSSALVFSCEKEIILDISPGEIDFVVEAWIYNGSGPLVTLSKQFSGYGTFNQATLADSLTVRDATITVNAIGGNVVQLVQQSLFDLPSDLLDQFLDANRIPRFFGQFAGQLAGFTLEQQLAFAEDVQDSTFIQYVNSLNFYIDTTNTLIGMGGIAYELNIEVDGKQLNALTTIPVKQDINFLSYTMSADYPNYAEVNINLTVPNNFDAFVLLSNRRSDTTAFYIPDYFDGGLSDNGIYAGSGTIDLPLLRGYADNEDPELGVLGLFEVGDELTLKWQNIDEATYNFWFSVFNDGGDTPFSSATKIQSNLNGGIGIWAGYNTSYTTITIQ